MSPAVKYGISVFEGVRAYWNEEREQLYVFRMREHTDRLFQSMKLLRFKPTFGKDEIDRLSLELLRRNEIRSNAALRVAAYIDGMAEQEAREPVSYAIAALERSRQTGVAEKGIRCQVSAWSRIDDTSMPPRIKTGANYINNSTARLQAAHDGYDDAILLNRAGKVAEATATSIFFLRRGRLVTPHLTSSVVESITRDTMLQLAADAGMEVEEREVEKTELYSADEIFLVGSAAEVKPVIDIDGFVIGTGEPGPVTRKMQTAYFETVSGKRADNRGWLTSVYTAST